MFAIMNRGSVDNLTGKSACRLVEKKIFSNIQGLFACDQVLGPKK